MSTVTTASFRAHERFLWGLGYRMLGSAADADDLVQDTFARALERPPADGDAPLLPWLVTVAMNLARDALRRRKRTPYVGPWLPAPIETDEHGLPGEPAAFEVAGQHSTEWRYDLLESVSMAFLIALETLSPPQRAVLLLRDVFDYSVAECAHVLGMGESNVKVTHLRARRKMESYDQVRRPVTKDLAIETRAALERFLGCVTMQDVAAAEAMLVEDARDLSDGGGVYRAALNPVLGASRVARFMCGLASRFVPTQPGDIRFEVRTYNGLPAVVIEHAAPTGWATRYLMGVTLGPDGRIRDVYQVIAPSKLSRVAPVP